MGCTNNIEGVDIEDIWTLFDHVCNTCPYSFKSNFMYGETVPVLEGAHGQCDPNKGAAASVQQGAANGATRAEQETPGFCGILG